MTNVWGDEEDDNHWDVRVEILPATAGEAEDDAGQWPE